MEARCGGGVWGGFVLLGGGGGWGVWVGVGGGVVAGEKAVVKEGNVRWRRKDSRYKKRIG